MRWLKLGKFNAFAFIFIAYICLFINLVYADEQKIPEGFGRVYLILGKTGFLGLTVKSGIMKLDSQELGTVERGQYMVLDLPPTNYVIKWTSPQNINIPAIDISTVVSIEVGKARYFQANLTGFQPERRFVEVSEDLLKGKVAVYPDANVISTFAKLPVTSKTKPQEDSSDLMYTGGGYEPASNESNATNSIYYNGGYYVGSLSNGIPNGRGKWTTGDVEFEGDFINGKVTGQGTAVYKNGTIYKGGYLNGLREGQGSITFSNGESYQGTFANGNFFDGNGKNNNGDVIRVWKSGDVVYAQPVSSQPATQSNNAPTSVNSNTSGRFSEFLANVLNAAADVYAAKNASQKNVEPQVIYVPVQKPIQITPVYGSRYTVPVYTPPPESNRNFP